MKSEFKLLVINPGSTSTKVAYYNNLQCISSKSLSHKTEELDKYKTIIDQYSLRKQAILEYMEEEGIRLEELDAVVGRGGMLKPLSGGTYFVNNSMLDDLKNTRYGKHASNLGAVIANEIASSVNIPAFIVNPVVVDEFEPLARYSGIPEIPRKSAFHALNQKAVAMRFAKESGKDYKDLNLIIAHLGGGISVAAHKKGRVVDVNNGLEEGPFSPERTGSVPALQLVEMCFSGRYSKEEIERKLVGKGGLTAYLGTSDCREIEQRIEAGDTDAKNVFEAMAYQISKEIAACSAVLYGNVDNILITGGIARSNILINLIAERVKFIAPLKVYPGEDELAALAEGAFRVLTGEEKALEYN